MHEPVRCLRALVAFSFLALAGACGGDGEGGAHGGTAAAAGVGGSGATGGTAGSSAGSGGAGGGGAGGTAAAGGAAGSAGVGGIAGSAGAAGSGAALLFDMDRIRDASTAACTFTNHRTTIDDGVSLDVWDVSYVSWESIDGTLEPITIRAFAAKPQGKSNLPGIVQAHGLGGFAEPKHATGTAALTSSFVVAYTGPGGGSDATNTSEGRASGFDNGYRMFDTLIDARGSWFWGHAVAAMRGLTCLQTRSEVDSSRLGMTGFSAGAVATLISSAVDDRIRAAVPLSGTGAWDLAVRSPDAWQHGLLTSAGLDTGSEEWRILLSELDSAKLLTNTSSNILMVNGTTDEFFPLVSHVATFDAIATSSKRTSLAGNFDHGCYALTGVESAQTIEDRAALRAAGGQRAWFAHWFGTDPAFSYYPDAPRVTVTAAGVASYVEVAADPGGSNLSIDFVKYWWSNDDAYVWGSVELDAAGGGNYNKLVAAPLQSNTAYYVDVQYRTGQLLAPKQFSVSSLPVLPAGFVPHIRGVDNCL